MLSFARSLLLLQLPNNSALVALALDRRFRCARSFLHRPLCARAEMEPEPETYKFGPYKISGSEVFFRTELSFAFVNLRPVVPGKISLRKERIMLFLKKNCAWLVDAFSWVCSSSYWKIFDLISELWKFLLLIVPYLNFFGAIENLKRKKREYCFKS